MGPSLRLYSNLRPPTDPQPMPEGFYVYVPEPKRAMTQVAPGVVQAAVEARRKRILEKVSSINATVATEGNDTDSSGCIMSHIPSQVASANGEGNEVAADGQSDEEASVNNPPKAKRTRLSTYPKSENAGGVIPPGNIASDVEADKRPSVRSCSVPVVAFSPPGCVARTSEAEMAQRQGPSPNK